MLIIESLLCLVGAFYAFAGFVATRAALTSHFMDRAISALGGEKPARAETVKTYWMLAAAGIILAGGASLLFLLDAAAWLFLASAAGQALYLLVLAPKFFDPVDPPEAAGRRSTVNAFVIYLASTAFVVWAWETGKLVPVQSAAWPALAIPAALIVAHVAYVVRTLATAPPPQPFAGLYGADANAALSDLAQSTRIKVMADYHCHPLWTLDAEMYGDIAPEALDLSPELTRDLNAWADTFTASLDPDDPAQSRWSEAETLAHEAMARPLAIRLAREKPDRTVFVFEGETGVVEVRADEELPPQPGGAGV